MTGIKSDTRIYKVILFFLVIPFMHVLTVLAQEENPKRVFDPVPGGKYTEPELILSDLEAAIKILTNYEDQPEWKSDLAARAYEMFSQNPGAGFEDLVANKKFRDLCDEQQIGLLGGPMLGQVSEKGASVWVRTLGEASVSVKVEGVKKPYGPVVSGPENDFAVGIEITGLKVNRSYRYSVFVDESGEAVASGTLKTVDPDNTRIIFGSCPHRWGLANPVLWKTALDRNADALLAYGDIAVQDRKFNFGMQRFDYFLRELHTPWRELTASLPVYVSWDDHDYYNNDHWGLGRRMLRTPTEFTDVSGTDADRLETRRVFMNSWNNPSYGFENDKGGIFFRTRIGAADVIMTDNRYFRRVEGPFLGEGQMKWLEEELLKCKGPFIIITCGTLWTDYKGEGKDSWGKFDPEGRERILSFIEENNIPGVLLLSGDWHGARGFTIPRPSGYTFYEFQPASLGGRGKQRDQDAGHRQKLHENWLYATGRTNAFGEFTFDTGEKDPTVTYRLVEEDGSEYYKITLTRSQLTPNP
jgi:alkaline phosphatase D